MKITQIDLINTSFQRGEIAPAINRAGVSTTTKKPLKRLPLYVLRFNTLLKQGVNEKTLLFEHVGSIP